MWIWALWAGCKHPQPESATDAASVPQAWECTAFVARQSADPPVTVSGAGETEAQADENAWKEACAALPPTVPPSPCALEAPPDPWTWTRTLQEGPPLQVTIVLQPSPVPYQGNASSTTSQDDACSRAYEVACAEAGAEPGCQALPGYVDGGVGAVEKGG